MQALRPECRIELCFIRSLPGVIPARVDMATSSACFCYPCDDLRVTAHLCDSHSLNTRVGVSLKFIILLASAGSG